MKKFSIIIIVIVVAIIATYYINSGRYYPIPAGSPTQEQATVPISNSDADTQPLSVETDDLSKVNELTITSGNFFYSPKSLTLKKGEPVKITFNNSGVHTFTVDELGINESIKGKNSVIEFTPAKSGTFEYYCAVPGHSENGMLGSLIIN